MPDTPTYRRPNPDELKLRFALRLDGEPEPEIVRAFIDSIRIPCRIIWSEPPPLAKPPARTTVAT